MSADQAQTREWSRFYRDERLTGIDVLHARFVRHRYPRHVHEHAVIALVDRGAASYWYRGAQHTAPAGHVFLVNAGEPHTGDPVLADGYVYRVLYPAVDFLSRITCDPGGGPGTTHFKETVIHDPPLRSALSLFHERLAAQAPLAECEAVLLHVFARLVTRYADPRATPRMAGSERPAVRTAREFIEAHFHEDLSIARLAALTALSPFYFARVFEREVGLPPHAYLESVRIRKARALIDRGESLASAAFSAGFADQSHLTRRFKRVLGITPGQYAGQRQSCLAYSLAPEKWSDTYGSVPTTHESCPGGM